MLQSKARLIFLVLVGVALAICGHLALKGLAYLAVPGHELTTKSVTVPMWYALSRPLLLILVQLVPAFLVGWWARQSGFILGALVGVVASVATAGLFNIVWQHVSYSDSSFYIELFLVWALPSAVSSSIAGAAGQFAQAGRPLTIRSSGRRTGAA
jgi:hypothetical protein